MDGCVAAVAAAATAGRGKGGMEGGEGDGEYIYIYPSLTAQALRSNQPKLNPLPSRYRPTAPHCASLGGEWKGGERVNPASAARARGARCLRTG